MAVTAGTGGANPKPKQYKSPAQKAAEARAAKYKKTGTYKPSNTKGTNQKVLLPAKPKTNTNSVIASVTGTNRRTPSRPTLAKPPSKPAQQPLIKPSTIMPGGQTAARTQLAADARRAARATPVGNVKPETAEQKAFREKWHRARGYEEAARRASSAPRVGSVGAVTPPSSSGDGRVKGPDGVMRTPQRQKEMDAWNEQVKRSEEIKRKQADAAKLSAYAKNANSAVNAELQPALNEIARQIADLQTRGTRSATDAQMRGERAQMDLAELFGRLSNFTGQIQNTQRQNYQELEQKVGSNYDALSALLGQNYGNAQAAASDENARLGLTGAGGVNNAGMVRDQAFLQGLAATDKAAQQSAMTNSGNSFDQLMAMARGNAETEGVARMAESKQSTERTIADLVFEMQQGTTNLQGRYGDIESTRGEKIRQMIEAMQERDYSRSMEQQQLAFERDLATKRFGLEQRQVDAALTPQPASYESQLDAALKEIQIQNELAKQKELQKPTRTYPTIPRAGYYNAPPPSFFPGRY